MDAQVIGKFIKENRIKHDLTQREVAENLHVSSKTISKWECGRGIPDYDSAEKLCKLFDVGISELLCGGVSNVREEAGEIGISEDRKKPLSVLLHVFNGVLFLVLLVVVAEVFKIPDYSKVLLLIDFYTIVIMLAFVNIVGFLSKTQRVFWRIFFKKSRTNSLRWLAEYWENALKIRMASVSIIGIGLFMIRFGWAFMFPSGNRTMDVFNMLLPLVYVGFFEGIYLIIGYASKIYVQKPITTIKAQVAFGIGVACFIVGVLLIQRFISPTKKIGEDEITINVKKDSDCYVIITDFIVPEYSVSFDIPLTKTSEIIFDDETYQFGDETEYFLGLPEEISQVFRIPLNKNIVSECIYISGNKNVSDLIICPRTEYKDSRIKEYILLRTGQSGEIPAVDVAHSFYPISEPIFEQKDINGKKFYCLSYNDISIAYLQDDGFWREYYTVGKETDLIDYVQEETK